MMDEYSTALNEGINELSTKKLSIREKEGWTGEKKENKVGLRSRHGSIQPLCSINVMNAFAMPEGDDFLKYNLSKVGLIAQFK